MALDDPATEAMPATSEFAGIPMSTFPDVAEELGLIVTQVHQLVRDGQLVACPGAAGVRRIPAGFIQDGVIVKGLRGVITLLRDAHFDDDEIVTWLYRPDDSLPGTPIDALRENRGTEVKRRAQSAGY